MGCTKYIKPRVYRVFWKYGLQMFDMLRPGLLAGGILCVALNLILRCKFSQNLPTNDSLKKVPVKLKVPENCILPEFFKILPPRRHSLGQRVRKGCGILSFSPSLYIFYIHTYMHAYIHTYIYTPVCEGESYINWSSRFRSPGTLRSGCHHSSSAASLDYRWPHHLGARRHASWMPSVVLDSH